MEHISPFLINVAKKIYITYNYFAYPLVLKEDKRDSLAEYSVSNERWSV